MDALVCQRPGILAMENRPDPERGAADVLVRPRRIGICGTDYHIVEGKHPFLEYPRIMGHELAVEVLAAPANSSATIGETYVVNPYISCGVCIACKAGKANCCVRISVLGVHRDGGMATLLAIPQQNLVRADGLTVDQCATVEFLAIGAHAVRRAQLKSSDRVLMVGAGPIGLGAAVFASLTADDVTVMDIESGRLDAARSIIGGLKTIAGGSEAKASVASATSGDGYDVVFDATGNSGSIEKSFDFVAAGGRYVLVSVVKGPITFQDPDFHRKELTLLGSRNATAEDFERVIEVIRERRFDHGKLITHRTTLAGAVQDIPNWAVHKQHLIKAVIATD
jgi:2-desacetyl-2-hydroxyethyl bacteriochlorophyllide A dehydrogenase